MKRCQNKLPAIILIIIALLAGLFYTYPKIQNRYRINQVEKYNRQTIQSLKQTKPEQAYLEVPFISQAPLETEENWRLHEESCEEAALLQAYLYETKQTISKPEANKIILDMIKWQKENLGGHHDLYADDMRKFIKGYYGIDAKVIYDAGIEEIKAMIDRKHTVIVPITGNILNNPYYPYPGYHMLTVTGYTEDRIITNDNGTRRGKDFSYDTKVFEQAMIDAGGDILILEIKNQ